MSNLRLAGIPLDHVVAEMAAFPLSSEASLNYHVTELDPDLNGSTGKLWRAAESGLLGSLPAVSVDELVAIRDRLWFGKSRVEPVSLANYLRHISNCSLALQRNRVMPCLPPDGRTVNSRKRIGTRQARRSWLWLSFAIPPDCLMSALNTNGLQVDQLDLLSPKGDLLSRTTANAQMPCRSIFSTKQILFSFRHIVYQRTE